MLGVSQNLVCKPRLKPLDITEMLPLIDAAPFNLLFKNTKKYWNQTSSCTRWRINLVMLHHCTLHLAIIHWINIFPFKYPIPHSQPYTFKTKFELIQLLIKIYPFCGETFENLHKNRFWMELKLLNLTVMIDDLISRRHIYFNKEFSNVYPWHGISLLAARFNSEIRGREREKFIYINLLKLNIFFRYI